MSFRTSWSICLFGVTLRHASAIFAPSSPSTTVFRDTTFSDDAARKKKTTNYVCCVCVCVCRAWPDVCSLLSIYMCMCRCLLVCSCWCAASRFRKLVRAEAMFADVEWILTQSVAWPLFCPPVASSRPSTQQHLCRLHGHCHRFVGRRAGRDPARVRAFRVVYFIYSLVMLVLQLHARSDVFVGCVDFCSYINQGTPCMAICTSLYLICLIFFFLFFYFNYFFHTNLKVAGEMILAYGLKLADIDPPVLCEWAKLCPKPNCPTSAPCG